MTECGFILCAIAAMSSNRVIGNNNELPWNIPEELQYFKEKTRGTVVIMGRKTMESMGGALPKRRNIVITRDLDYKQEGVEVVHSLDKAIEAAETGPQDRDEVFIIGGAEIYKQSLPQIDRLYLTIINKVYDGDRFFPEVDFENEFKIISRSPGFSRKPNAPEFEYIVAERRP